MVDTKQKIFIVKTIRVNKENKRICGDCPEIGDEYSVEQGRGYPAYQGKSCRFGHLGLFPPFKRHPACLAAEKRAKDADDDRKMEECVMRENWPKRKGKEPTP